jgi:energy-coupling factor transport system permease protein
VLLALAFALPFALVVGLVNPLVVRDGLTVIARLGTVPVFGQLDITAEATAYGGVLALRALVVIGCFALHSAAVDPDDLLRAFRRISFRSALTAALATRLVPVLGRDARRLSDAQRCLAGEPAPRRAIVRAVAAGALDRAVDVAATLEVRGYGAARRPPRGGARPWSRHDLAFAASAAGLVVVGIAAHIAGAEAFEAYPSFEAPMGAQQLGLGAVLAACVLLPFADRRGIGP